MSETHAHVHVEKKRRKKKGENKVLRFFFFSSINKYILCVFYITHLPSRQYATLMHYMTRQYTSPKREKRGREEKKQQHNSTWKNKTQAKQNITVYNTREYKAIQNSPVSVQVSFSTKKYGRNFGFCSGKKVRKR